MREALIKTADGTIPIRSYSLPLPKGDAGVELTVRLMNSKIQGEEGSRHPGVRAFALQATRNAPDRDDWQQAQALFHAVKRKVRFRGEQDETIQTPWLTLQLNAGDCDDHTTLLVALLRSIGLAARIQTIALDGSKAFEHVFAMVGVRDHRGKIATWRPLDTTVASAVPGWQPPNPTRRKLWSDDSLRFTQAPAAGSGALPFTALKDFDRRSAMHNPYYGYEEQRTLGMSFFKRILQIGKIGTSAAVGFVVGGPVGAVKGGMSATAKAVAKGRADKAARHAAAAAHVQESVVSQVGVPPTMSPDPTLGGYHRFDGREFRRVGIDYRRFRREHNDWRERERFDPNARRFDGHHLRGRLDPREFGPRGRYLGDLGFDFGGLLDSVKQTIPVVADGITHIKSAVRTPAQAYQPQQQQSGDGRNAAQDQTTLDQELAQRRADQGGGNTAGGNVGNNTLTASTWIPGIPNYATGIGGALLGLLLVRR